MSQMSICADALYLLHLLLHPCSIRVSSVALPIRILSSLFPSFGPLRLRVKVSHALNLLPGIKGIKSKIKRRG